MKKLFFILAAVTMIIVACKKEDNDTPTPVKHAVLAGMDVDKMVFYGDVIYYYTYDADGHLATSTQIADNEIHTSTYVWENGELIAVNTGNGTGYGDTVIAFETSDAPAQALFNRMKYDNDISELCSQGCFGTLPVHMPSKRSLTLYLEGIPVRTITTEYAYTVENDCLATCQVDDNMTFTFCWEER